MGEYGKAEIAEIEPGSLADKSGLKEGDLLLKIDGRRLRDAIDCYSILAHDGTHEIIFERQGVRLGLSLKTGTEPLGISFSRAIFGELLKCNNRCLFCFVDQLPPGLNPLFYVKDDDYRLSFLYGNFITLTNLRKSHIKRIVDERISPLYVSLHSTEAHLRRVMFGNRRADTALRVLRTLLDAGIKVHVQIVLMKGLNDGKHLAETLDTLSSSYPEISSIGVVPVGISKGGRLKVPMSYGFDSSSAAEVLEYLEKWRVRFREAGPFAADEFFYLASVAPPDASYYFNYPQIENGIGLARKFIDGCREVIKARGRRTGRLPGGTGSPGKIGLVTTPIGAWVLKEIDLPDRQIERIVCTNSLLGERVTVCGLLPGRDIIRKISRCRGFDRFLIPNIALNEGRFIDGIHADEISHATKANVEFVECEPSKFAYAVGMC